MLKLLQIKMESNQLDRGWHNLTKGKGSASNWLCKNIQHVPIDDTSYKIKCSDLSPVKQ